MSVRDLNKCLTVYDCLNGNVITTIDMALYDKRTIISMLTNLFLNDFENEHGLMIKFGYKS